MSGSEGDTVCPDVAKRNCVSLGCAFGEVLFGQSRHASELDVTQEAEAVNGDNYFSPFRRTGSPTSRSVQSTSGRILGDRRHQLLVNLGPHPGQFILNVHPNTLCLVVTLWGI